MTLQIATPLTPVSGQPGLFYGRRASARFEPRDVVLEAFCPSNGLLEGLAGLFGFDAAPTPHMRDFANASDFGWYTLSAADKKKFGTIKNWWQAYGKDNRISGRASFAATQAEKPDATPAEAQKWWRSLSKDTRKEKRAKYTKGYGDNFLDDVANVVKKGVSVIPVYGQAVAAGINVAQGQGAFKDPFKAAAFLVGGTAGGQIAPFVSKKGLRLNTAALKEAVQSNVDMLKGASSGVGVKDTQLPQNLSLPKMPDIAKLAKQGSPVAKDILKTLKDVKTPSPEAIKRAIKSATQKVAPVLARKLPVKMPARLPSWTKPAVKTVAKTLQSNKDVLALRKQLDKALSRDRKEDAEQAKQLRQLQNELNKTKQDAAVQNAIQKAVQEALSRQAMYAQQSYGQPPVYATPQYLQQPQAQLPSYQPPVYASQALPELSPEDYAALQPPEQLMGILY